MPARSAIPVVLDRFRPSVPSPATVVTVTVRVVPGPAETALTDPLAVPVAARLKLPVAPPETDSLNVTSHCSEVALVGVPVTRLMDTTVGAVVSMVQVKLAAEPVLPALSTARTWTCAIRHRGRCRASGGAGREAATVDLALGAQHAELTLPAVGSAVVNEKLALAEVLGFDGLAVIDAVGFVWSTV